MTLLTYKVLAPTGNEAGFRENVRVVPLLLETLNSWRPTPGELIKRTLLARNPVPVRVIVWPWAAEEGQAVITGEPVTTGVTRTVVCAVTVPPGPVAVKT